MVTTNHENEPIFLDNKWSGDQEQGGQAKGLGVACGELLVPDGHMSVGPSLPAATWITEQQ